MNEKLTSRKPVVLAAAALMIAAVGCGGDDATTPLQPPSETTILSLEAIAGDWEGETRTPIPYWVEISITRQSAEANTLVGTLGEYTLEGGSRGSPRCLGELFALDSDPPTYTFRLSEQFVVEPFVCTGRVQLVHDEAAGALTYSWQPEPDGPYRELATISRAN